MSCQISLKKHISYIICSSIIPKSCKKNHQHQSTSTNEKTTVANRCDQIARKQPREFRSPEKRGEIVDSQWHLVARSPENGTEMLGF